MCRVTNRVHIAGTQTGRNSILKYDIMVHGHYLIIVPESYLVFNKLCRLFPLLTSTTGIGITDNYKYITCSVYW